MTSGCATKLRLACLWYALSCREIRYSMNGLPVSCCRIDTAVILRPSRQNLNYSILYTTPSSLKPRKPEQLTLHSLKNGLPPWPIRSRHREAQGSALRTPQLQRSRRRSEEEVKAVWALGASKFESAWGSLGFVSLDGLEL